MSIELEKPRWTRETGYGKKFRVGDRVKLLGDRVKIVAVDLSTEREDCPYYFVEVEFNNKKYSNGWVFTKSLKPLRDIQKGETYERTRIKTDS